MKKVDPRVTCLLCKHSRWKHSPDNIDFYYPTFGECVVGRAPSHDCPELRLVNQAARGTIIKDFMKYKDAGLVRW